MVSKLVAAANAPQSVKDSADYVCSGTNDHTIIQTAIDSIGNNDSVILSQGTFILNGNLSCKSYITIQGAGKENTILQWTSGKINCDTITNFNLKEFTSKGTGKIWIFNCKHAKFENICLKTDNSGWQAAFQMWAGNSTIEDIEFLYCDAIDCGSHGWQSDGEGTPRDYINIKYIGCKAINCGRYTRNNNWCCGFQLAENGNGDGYLLENCYAEGNFEAGFIVEGAPIKKNYVIKNCVSKNNGTKPDDYYNPEEENYGVLFGAGFWMHGGVVVEDCYAEGNSKAGFACWYPNSGYITKFIRCEDKESRTGFFIDFTSYVEITNCISRNAIRHGVYIANAENITTQNLECVNPGGYNNSCNQFGIQGYPVKNSVLNVSLRGGNYTALSCVEGVNVTFTGEVLTNASPKVNISGSVDTSGLNLDSYSGESPYSPIPEGSILIAAYNTPTEKKATANYICSSANDYHPIVSALSASRTGDTLVFLEGTYNVPVNLYARGNTTIMGEGTDKTVFNFTSDGRIRVEKEYVTLKDFKFSQLNVVGEKWLGAIVICASYATITNIHGFGDRTTACLFHTVSHQQTPNNRLQNITFTDCKVENSHTYAFMHNAWEGSSSGSRTHRNITYRRCKSINNGNTSQPIDTRYLNYPDNNYRFNEWVCGFDFAETNNIDNLLVEDCIAENNWESGFHMEFGTTKTNIIFRRCISKNNGKKPVYPNQIVNPYQNFETKYGEFFGSGFYLPQFSGRLEECYTEGNSRYGYWVTEGGILVDCIDKNTAIGRTPTQYVQPASYFAHPCQSIKGVNGYSIELIRCKSIDSNCWAFEFEHTQKARVVDFELINPAGYNGVGGEIGTSRAGGNVRDCTFEFKRIQTKSSITAFKAFNTRNITFGPGVVVSNAAKPVRVTGSATNSITFQNWITVSNVLPIGPGGVFIEENASPNQVTQTNVYVTRDDPDPGYEDPPEPPIPEEPEDDILVAAYDAPQSVKDIADFVCSGIDDQNTLGLAFIEAGEITPIGKVVLSEGTFNISDYLNLPGNIVLAGQGPNNTELSWSSGFMLCDHDNIVIRDFFISGSGAIWLRGNQNVSISNIVATVDDSQIAGAFTLWAPDEGLVKNVKISNCKAINCGRHGWMLDGYGENHLIKDVELYNCEAINCGRYSRIDNWIVGFDLSENANLEGLDVINCLAEGSWESGFHFEATGVKRDITILNCVSRNNGLKPDDYYNEDTDTYGCMFGSGYWLHGGITIQNCLSENNRNGGFSVWGPDSYTQIIGCTDRSSTYGYRLIEVSNVFIKNSYSYDAANLGVFCTIAENIEALDLKIINPGEEYGISNIFGSTEIGKIKNCSFNVDIYGGSGMGLMCLYGENVEFSGILRTNNVPKLQVSEGVDISKLTILDYHGELPSDLPIIPEDPHWFGLYKYRHKLVIPQTGLSYDLDKTIIPIVLSGSKYQQMFNDVGNDFSKITITTSDKTELYIEVVYWDEIRKSAEICVFVPNVHASKETELFLYFDEEASPNEKIGLSGSSVTHPLWNELPVISAWSGRVVSNMMVDSTPQHFDIALSGSGISLEMDHVNNRQFVRFNKGDWGDIQIPINVLNNSMAITIEATIKPHSLNKDIWNEQMWFGESPSDTNRFYLAIYGFTPKWATGIGDRGWEDNSSPQCVESITHITWTIDPIAGISKLYVNGLLVETKEFTTTLFTKTLNLAWALASEGQESIGYASNIDVYQLRMSNVVLPSEFIYFNALAELGLLITHNNVESKPFIPPEIEEPAPWFVQGFKYRRAIYINTSKLQNDLKDMVFPIYFDENRPSTYPVENIPVFGEVPPADYNNQLPYMFGVKDEDNSPFNRAKFVFPLGEEYEGYYCPMIVVNLRTIYAGKDWNRMYIYYDDEIVPYPYYYFNTVHPMMDGDKYGPKAHQSPTHVYGNEFIAVFNFPPPHKQLYYPGYPEYYEFNDYHYIEAKPEVPLDYHGSPIGYIDCNQPINLSPFRVFPEGYGSGVSFPITNPILFQNANRINRPFDFNIFEEEWHNYTGELMMEIVIQLRDYPQSVEGSTQYCFPLTKGDATQSGGSWSIAIDNTGQLRFFVRKPDDSGYIVTDPFSTPLPLNEKIYIACMFKPGEYIAAYVHSPSMQFKKSIKSAEEVNSSYKSVMCGGIDAYYTQARLDGIVFNVAILKECQSEDWLYIRAMTMSGDYHNNVIIGEKEYRDVPGVSEITVKAYVRPITSNIVIELKEYTRNVFSYVRPVEGEASISDSSNVTTVSSYVNKISGDVISFTGVGRIIYSYVKPITSSIEFSSLISVERLVSSFVDKITSDVRNYGVPHTEKPGGPRDVLLNQENYRIELRNNQGKIIAILENAFNISLMEEINTPAIITFDLPANDDKVNLITVDHQIWVRDMINNKVVLKMILQQRRDKRGGV